MRSLNHSWLSCPLQVTQSPEGTQVLEDLPGDHVNIAVQVRGGPSDHEATAWILVSGSFVSDYWLLLTGPCKAPFIFL